jgi:hypothetical protein
MVGKAVGTLRFDIAASKDEQNDGRQKAAAAERVEIDDNTNIIDVAAMATFILKFKKGSSSLKGRINKLVGFARG